MKLRVVMRRLIGILCSLVLLIGCFGVFTGCLGFFAFGNIDKADRIMILWSGLDDSYFCIENAVAVQKMAQLIPSTKNSVKGTKIDEERVNSTTVIRINYLDGNYHAASVLVDKDLYAYYATLTGGVRVFEERFKLEKFVFIMLSHSLCTQVQVEGVTLDQLLPQLQSMEWALSTTGHSNLTLVSKVTFNCARNGSMLVYQADNSDIMRLEISIGGQYNFTFVSK